MLYNPQKIFIPLLCLLQLTVVAQIENASLKKIAPWALRSDFMLLRDTMQKIHPAMYRYNSKKTIDHIFDSCYASIHDSMTIPEFFPVISAVIATIGDGHANCKLPRNVMDDFMNSAKVFPAIVMFIHSRAFIFCCKQNDSLTGTELLSVNGQPVKTVVQKLFGFITTDGRIQSRKNWEMPENFQLLYHIVYGAQDSYPITYKTKSGEIRKTTLQADIIKNFICKSPFSRPAKYLQLSYTADNTAVLTLQTFFDGFLEQTGENFRRFLDSSFADIGNRKIGKLLIDVRYNQGGNDNNGALLYSYLVDKPFRYYAALETATEKFTENGHSLLGIQQPNQNSYSGKVYILINGRSFSGVAEFASIAKTNGRAIFIGEECGGGYYGNSSGDEAMVTLPNSQLTARIPLIKYTMAVKKDVYADRGVIPDYPIYPTIEDIIEHTDNQLAYAVRLIGKK
jgi:Peptidase family S41